MGSVARNYPEGSTRPVDPIRKVPEGFWSASVKIEDLLVLFLATSQSLTGCGMCHKLTKRLITPLEYLLP